MTATQPKTVRTIRLEADSSSGGKFYTITMFEHEQTRSMPWPNFTVETEYGAIAGQLKTGTKTPRPVTREKADSIFYKLVDEKKTGESHYREVTGKLTGRNMPASNPAPGESVCLPPRLLNDVDGDQHVLQLVQDDDWWVQIKHDGERVQLHVDNGVCVMFSGRSAKLRACPQAISVAMKDIKGKYVIDGELVEQTIWAFDLMHARIHPKRKDESILDHPYSTRYVMLRQLLNEVPGKAIEFVKAAMSHAAKVEAIFNAKADKQEGVVFINKTAPYIPGRPNSGGKNLRWKFKASASLIVAAHNHHRGKQSIDVRLFDGTVIGTCSVIGKTAYPIGSVVECEYLYCQSKLVQPVLKGIRTDVNPSDCTRAQLQFKDGIDPLKGKR